MLRGQHPAEPVSVTMHALGFVHKLALHSSVALCMSYLKVDDVDSLNS